MNNYFKEWFSFSRSERNGLLVLFVILVILISLKIYFSSKDEIVEYDFEPYEAEIENFKQNNSINTYNVFTNIEDSVVLFDFDPNTVTVNEMEKLGFSSKNAQSWDKFRNKGAKFFKPEDFKKLYFVTDSIFSIYKNHIIIEKENHENKYEKFSKNENYSKPKYENKKQAINIELNTADTLILLDLPGIGSSFSKRIIKYRDKLGGFYSTNQLMEVYGFSDEMLTKIINYINIDVSKIKKIDINSAGFKDLIKHPYLNKQKVILILDYRKVMGSIKSMDDLVKNKVIDATDAQKLSQYFQILD